MDEFEDVCDHGAGVDGHAVGDEVVEQSVDAVIGHAEGAGGIAGAERACRAETEPRGHPGRAALVATAASVGGLGLGPLLGSALAQYAPAPRVLPFAVEIAALIPAAAAVAALPAAATRSRWRPRRPRVPAAGRGTFWRSGIAQRAGVLSAFYVIVYLGVGLPVIGVGFAATASGLLRAVQYFAVAVAAGCLAAGAALARRRRRRDRAMPWT